MFGKIINNMFLAIPLNQKR